MYYRGMTPERVLSIYENLEKLVIQLDPDPASRGYKYLQDLISKTRGFLNEASYYLTEVLRDRHVTEMSLQAEESAFEVRADELLARDPRVSRLPNIDDRKAMINVLLGDDKRKIQKLKMQLKNLGHVEKVVRHRHKELEATMSAIRLQRSLVEAETHTGSFYGDEGDASRGSRGAAPSQDFDDDELQKLFDETQEELTAAASEPPAQPAREVPSGPKDDFEDLLTGLLDEAEPDPPQPVVEAPSVAPKQLISAASDEDPAIGRFLDGDVDFDDMFGSV